MAASKPTTSRPAKANRLAAEPSPYLRQHADNPVDWYPWGPEAFAEAARRNVPVFLSIGYATCHWCHVMAHESFEDPEVAAAMNGAFVNVKVDREERPDIDETYMAVCQFMTGSGGWPLTVILTPDKKPFFAGTYFPKHSRHGRIGMLDLCSKVTEVWAQKADALQAQGEHILQHVRGEEHAHDGEGQPANDADGDADVGASGGEGRDGGSSPDAPDALGLATLQAGVAQLAARFDRKHGGFGNAPKFPSPHQVLFLLRMHHRGDPQALAMATATLEAMQLGGIRDHVGGGFHRYSTDAQWLTPHFEKMLYDQAMLAMAYAEAHHATGRADFAATARSTLDYVLRDLQDPEGGLRCAEDADSEGVEGKFYVWSLDELQEALGGDAARFAALYQATREGNFLDEATHKRTGANILHLARPLTVAEESFAAPLRAKLLAIRSRRVRPSLDDKVITDWNGLAIAALAQAGRILREPRYVQAAERAATFLHARMRKADGALRHRYHAGRTDEHAFLDDHAFLLWGLLELYSATGQPRWLAWATRIAKDLQRHATPDGAFTTAAADGEDLGARRKDAYDGALPSGNSAACYALHRLGLLTGDPRHTQAADGVLAAFAPQVAQMPQAFTMMLCALDLAVGPTRELVITEGAGQEALLAAASGYQPRLTLLKQHPDLAKVAPWTLEHKPIGGKAAAYLCEGHACRNPTTDAAGLRRALA